MSAYIYLPWVRQGLSGAIETTDLSADTVLNRVKMTVQLALQNTPDPVQTTVRMYGPGDVVGFDPNQVIRTEPKNLAQNFEPNYFPFVEFDRPDFPWLFTPAKANAKGQLRPWICLVVVEKTEKNLSQGQPLPVLTIDNIQASLPDLSECWAWAYTQVLETQDILDTLANKPEKNLSRLVCPRKLEADKVYYACVVPTFKAGVLAGLGQPVPADDPLEPAWAQTSDGTQLPVYFHWEFSTGPSGDFEALVWKLQRRDLRSLAGQIGSRPMSVPYAQAGNVGLEGALRVLPPDALTENAVSAQIQGFSQAMQTVINAPDFVPSSPVLGDLTIKPPFYGQWHGACKALLAQDSKQCPEWAHALNIDPRHRAAAALGTRIVQEQQEQLMASAWEQVEGIEKANQLLRQAQIARQTGRGVYQQLGDMPRTTLIAVAGPVHSQVSLNGQTVYGLLQTSPIPENALKAPFRKISRARGPLSRRSQAKSKSGFNTGRLIERLNKKQIHVTSPAFTPAGMTTRTLDTYFANLTANDPVDLSFVNQALKQQQGLHHEGKPQPNYEPANLENVGETLWNGLDPEVTVVQIWEERIHPRPPEWKPEDALEPIMAAPEFPTPMYKPLVEISQDLLLPGVSQVPADTITALYTNPRFVRAFMVGLNHEMSRELLWREFPTDQRGTYFRQFWDPAGAVPRPQTPDDWEKLKDIAPIHTWDRKQGLDAALGVDPLSEQIVLLIRGELLHRYPNSVIAMAKAIWKYDAATDTTSRGIQPVIYDTGNPNYISPGDARYPEKYPIFTGNLSPDITFMCFNVSPADAVGSETEPHTPESAGWFFILQQPPTEPRYGLDETVSDAPPASWMDLAWPHVAKTAGGYISLAGGLQNFIDLRAPSQAGWGEDLTSADLASIMLQRPVRLAIHASDLLA